jgi:hydroxymethylbilane synthase
VLIGSTLAGLQRGAVVATGSVRRRAQLTVVRPDLQFRELRGNIHTRLGKVPDGGAIVMAAAALEVLGLSREISDYLPPAMFVPSPGQGCVAIECRSEDADMIEVLSTIDDHATRQAVEVERAFLAELGSGCSLPVGAHADDHTLTAFLGSANGHDHLTESIELADDRTLALTRSAELARSMHKRLQ